MEDGLFKPARKLEAVTRPRSTDAARNFKAVWAIVGVILTALTTGAGYAIKATHVLDKKADVSAVQGAEDQLQHLQDHVAASDAAEDARLSNLEDGQRWQMDFDMEAAQHWGIVPPPRPTPRPIPKPTGTP